MCSSFISVTGKVSFSFFDHRRKATMQLTLHLETAEKKEVSAKDLGRTHSKMTKAEQEAKGVTLFRSGLEE
jgi:hypothetical protein